MSLQYTRDESPLACIVRGVWFDALIELLPSILEDLEPQAFPDLGVIKFFCIREYAKEERGVSFKLMHDLGPVRAICLSDDTFFRQYS